MTTLKDILEGKAEPPLSDADRKAVFDNAVADVQGAQVAAEELVRPVVDLLDYESLLRKLLQVRVTPGEALVGYTNRDVVLPLPTWETLSSTQDIVRWAMLGFEDQETVAFLLRHTVETRKVKTLTEALTAFDERSTPKIVCARADAECVRASVHLDKTNDAALMAAGYVGAVRNALVMRVADSAQIDPVPSKTLFCVSDPVGEMWAEIAVGAVTGSHVRYVHSLKVERTAARVYEIQWEED